METSEMRMPNHVLMCQIRECIRRLHGTIDGPSHLTGQDRYRNKECYPDHLMIRSERSAIRFILLISNST